MILFRCQKCGNIEEGYHPFKCSKCGGLLLECQPQAASASSDGLAAPSGNPALTARPLAAPESVPAAAVAGRFIIFEPRPSAPKTKVWAVCSKDGGIIGRVSWYGPWRKYCFFPQPDTVYEQICLREIAQFCERETQKHRSKPPTDDAPARGVKRGAANRAELSEPQGERT